MNLQAPLYCSYVGQSTLGATAVTIAFAAYVAGLMPSLLLLGGLSDRIGRRISICFALLPGVLATYLLVVIPSWHTLIFARFLLGIATTAGTAYMTEIIGEDHTRQAALIVTSATSLGFGGDALATGISLTLQGHSFLPASFMFLFVLAPVLAFSVLILPRVDLKKAVSLLRLPVFPRGTWVYGIAMALAWSATGMTIAVVPLQLEQHNLSNWTGPVIFLAIFVGFLCQPFAEKMSNANALWLGLGFVMVPVGFCTMFFGTWSQQIPLVLFGYAITSGTSYRFSYLASLSEFSFRAPENRARATAGLFVYAYVGFSISVIASGALADKYRLLNAMGLFGAALVILTASVMLIWQRDRLISQRASTRNPSA